MSLLDRYALIRIAPEAEIVARQKADTALQEALQLEPRVQVILGMASMQRNLPGYQRDRVFSDLKRQWTQLVGIEARIDALATSRHYDAVMRAVDEWLPEDVIDLRLDHNTYQAWLAEAGIEPQNER